MLEGIGAKVLDILQSLGLGKVKEWATHDDRGVKLFRRLRLISATPKPDFDSIYAYALVEYGSRKSLSILGFFRHPFIKKAFQMGFDQGDFSPVYDEAQNFLDWWNLAPQLHRLRFDYQRGINEFIGIFNQLTVQTRTPVEVKQDQALEKIDRGQAQIQEKQDQMLAAFQNQVRLVLDFEWFKAKFEKQIAGVRDKFNPELHTQTAVDHHVHAILCDETQLRSVNQLLLEIIENQEQFTKSAQALSSPNPRLITWGNTRDGLVEIAQNIERVVGQLIEDFQNALAELKYSRFEYVQNAQWKNVLNDLIAAIDAYSSRADQINPSTLPCQGDDEAKRWAVRDADEQIHNPAWQAHDFVDKAQYIFDQLDCLKQSSLHVLGEAGIGKTHLAAHICSERIDHGLPALLLLGRQFTSDAPIEDQLLQILDIPPAFSGQDFLQAITAAANEYHTRIPIIIDGLNEATYHGAFSNIWRVGLPGFTQEIAAVQNIVLITTCRETYKEVVWPDTPRKSFITAYGFDEYTVEEAIRKYFAWYKIRAEFTAISLAHFEHPIYLQIFCASKNPARQEEVHAYIGQDSIFNVYDEYLDQVNRTVSEHLHLHPRTSVAVPALRRLGEYLWIYQAREIPFDDFIELIDGLPRDHLVWDNSKTQAILAEGLLVYRDWGENQERLYFTHDLLAGYMIAAYIIEQAQNDLTAYLNSDVLIQRLFGDDFQQFHPLHEDICRCLAALLPIRTGQYLHELVDKPKAFDASIRALFKSDQPQSMKTRLGWSEISSQNPKTVSFFLISCLPL